ncbi:hypothetical protein BC830DRAFT_731364 [Chytriomyces sp. MP71]|nr:hypothetical protein BC830DRAFT_731364 [Chytriomyces sp. MP71]
MTQTVTPTMSSFNAPASVSPDALFGLDDDLFDFAGLAPPLPPQNTSPPTSVKASPLSAPIDLSLIDVSQDLVASIIGAADPTVLSLFDANVGAVFQSLFPDATPVQAPAVSAPQVPAPVNPLGLFASASVALGQAQALEILQNAEAHLGNNPLLRPAVERLRNRILAANGVAPSPSLTSASSATPFLGFGSPDDSLAFLTSPDMSGGSPLMGLDGFSVPWDTSSLFPAAASCISAPVGASNASSMDTAEKPKSKAGRKRKERSNDADALRQELDLKRQRNTESARRSRVKRMAELEDLHRNLENAVEGEKRAQEKCRVLEAELEKARKLLALAGERLKAL